MRILITGGAGFIGTCLAHRLAKDVSPSQITLLDLPGRFTEKHKDFSKIEADIRVPAQLKRLESSSYETVIHLAAEASGYLSQRFPKLYMDTNLTGTVHLMNAIRHCGVASLVFASSMAVYEDGELALSESDPLVPKSIYGFTKLAGEQFVSLKATDWGIPYTHLRFFNVYGAGQDFTNLNQGMASIYLAQLFRYGEVRVKGSLSRFRDFVYVTDVAEAICRVMKHPQNETFNVGTGVKTTVEILIQQLCPLVAKHVPLKPSPIVQIGAHEGDAFGTVADIRKLSALGWSPTVSLRDGLPLMVEDMIRSCPPL